MAKELIAPSALRRELASATDPEKFMQIKAAAAGCEGLIEAAGYGRDREKARPYRETVLEARWRLGGYCASIENGRPGPNGFAIITGPSGPQLTKSKEIKRLYGDSAREAKKDEKLHALPFEEMQKHFRGLEKAAELPTLVGLLDLAKSYWSKVVRKAKHKRIRDDVGSNPFADLGPFPLIYADPPWKWGHFGERDRENEKGKARTPDQHYETLPLDQICDYAVGTDKTPLKNLIHDDAALFLWCTSSNIPNALEVMKFWGFEFKSSAAWVKMKDGKLQTGMGLVFRNAHEILLYGTRGKMPGPQRQFPSVFIYPRTRHSAKPPEIRDAIAKMYPDFDEKTRLELFTREKVEGWTGDGFESQGAIAA
jgi:N6-adenosine-specific RNA methylase IME4